MAIAEGGARAGTQLCRRQMRIVQSGSERKDLLAA